MSLVLFGVGGLLALLGAVSLFTDPPPDVLPEVRRTVGRLFLVGGVIGIALIALGVFIRTRQQSRGMVAMLWVGYCVFWFVLLALIVFVGSDVVRIAAEAGDTAKPLIVLMYLTAFLGAPVIEVIARRSRRIGESPNVEPLHEVQSQEEKPPPQVSS